MSASGKDCETVGYKLLHQSGQDSHPWSGTPTSGGTYAFREGKTPKLYGVYCESDRQVEN